MKAPTAEQAFARVKILNHVIGLLREARMADPVHFPGLARKIRSALKSAQGALRNAERFL
jgi:hypothetical protein